MESRKFVVEGDKLVREALRAEDRVHLLVASEEWIKTNPDVGIQMNGNMEVADAKTMKKLSSFISSASVLAVLNIPDSPEINVDGILPVLDDVRDPGNFGTIIRTASWFGFKQILCSRNCVDIYNPKVVQASMGAIFNVDVHYSDLPEIVQDNKHMKVLVSSMDATTDLADLDVKNAFIIMGNESHGVSAELLALATDKFKINSSSSEVESLNVAMATGIILYHFRNS